MADPYDLIVIGTGPGGYVCAIRAAQLGLKVAVVEKRATHGGTCLNVGCIPSKAMLHASHAYEEAGHGLPAMGIEATPKLDLAKMLAFKDEGVKGNVDGVAFLLKQGMSFKLSSKVTGVAKNAANHKIAIAPAAGGGESMVVDADVVLVAIGRVPYTDGLGLETAGVKLDNKKRIVVDQHFQTSVPGVYALGDVIAGPMLAHKAEDEGMAVAEILAGQAGHVNYDAIPNVIYTFPEVASVGKTEEELKAAGIAYVTGKFPFTANGRAKVNRTTDGFVKILADAKTDRVLGVHIVGADAGTMISEATIAVEFGGAAEDIARTCHPHPTLSEAVKEAALG